MDHLTRASQPSPPQPVAVALYQHPRHLPQPRNLLPIGRGRKVAPPLLSLAAAHALAFGVAPLRSHSQEHQP